MTAQERPAGRPACGARPAGALPDRRNTGTPSKNPLIIRAVLEHEETHTLLATSVRFGVSVRTITRWRARRDAAAAAGRVWPTDADVAYWTDRQAERAQGRARQRAWQRSRALAGGQLLIDATGTTRRLRALAVLGWRLEDLAPLLGVVEARIGHLTRSGNPTVHRRTAAAVAAVYERLSMTQGPSARTRALAANRDWSPPLAWDDHTIDDPAARPDSGRGRRDPAFDEVAVQRAMRGDPVHLRPVERAEAIRRLTGQGLSASEIAERLNTTPRSVTRHRSADTRRSA